MLAPANLNNSKDQLLQKRVSAHILQQITSLSLETLEAFDKLQILAPCTDLSTFYAAFKDCKADPLSETDPWDLRIKLHARYRDHLQKQLESEFSGEECNGNFLDLVSMHLEHKAKDLVQLDYIQFLRTFDQPEFLREQSCSWIQQLERYLYTFIERTMPLFDLPQMHTDLIQQFSNTEFYCRICNKAFAKETVFQAHLQSKKHKVKEDNSTTIDSTQSNQSINIFLISSYMSNVLEPIRENTIANIQRKASLTLREREAELLHTEEEGLETESNTPSLIYNPLKLPLDWDGKPIPYWLWRLHGLGTEFPCEICGGYRYLGRKAFDRHFQEWRHLHGLKCIGLSASGAASARAFYGVTAVEDALKLGERLRVQQRTRTFRPETMEEYEDEEGNVFSRKTFEDLKRQGII